MRGKGKRLTPAEEKEMISWYLAGENVHEIVKKLGVDIKTLSNVRKRNNIPRRPMIKLDGSDHWNYKGGKLINKNGYELVLVSATDPYASMRDNKKYVAKHRLVMAEHLGRPLYSNEQVHHIDGNRKNNGIHNLQLRKTYHGSGQAFECQNCGSKNVKAIKL